MVPIRPTAFFPVTRRRGAGSRRGGFTQVELIAVLAIMLVLTLLSLVVFPRARDAAHRGRCISNLRSIHSAMAGFAADNSGFLPSVEAKSDGDRPPNAQENWWMEIVPYYTDRPRGSAVPREPAILTCPVHVRNLISTGLSEGAVRNRTYGMNSALGFCSEATLNSRQRVRFSSIPDPARTIMVSEAAFNSITPLATLRAGNIRSSAMFNGTYTGGTHQGAGNILWADGHVTAWPDVALLASGADGYWRSGF